MSTFFIRDVELSKKQIDQLTQSDMFNLSICCLKTNLFKYYPNTIKEINGVARNFSKEALKNNTVYLSIPSEFDDPYDCNIYVDPQTFFLQRLRYFANICGVEINLSLNYQELAMKLAETIYQHIYSGKSLEDFYKNRNDCELIRLDHEAFFLRLELELRSANANEYSYYIAFNKAITTEYNDIQKTANRFRIACFAQTPYSMLMWSHYANNHQGFCIEYETPDYSKENTEIFQSLFPVIYTDTRTDLSQVSLNWRSTGKLTNEELWDYYKYGLLSKSLDWKYQQEWRLISCDDLLTDKSYNCKFFKIKKVYLGNKMPPQDREEIIEICKNNGISYTGVTIAPNCFNMSDCAIQCENCEKHKQALKDYYENNKKQE